MSEAGYLLDTDICIYLIKRKPLAVVERLASLPSGLAMMSVITLGELRLGAEKSQQRERNLEAIDRLIQLLAVEPLAEAAAACYGSIRGKLERRGLPIGNNDCWIAAHAMACGKTLVTNNEREFGRVRGLTVENWVSGEA